MNSPNRPVKLLVLVFLIVALPALVHSQDYSQIEYGLFSSYLAGVYDTRDDRFTKVQIINPTSRDLELLIVFLDEVGTALACNKTKIPSNGLFELQIDQGYVEKRAIPAFGVLKFLAIDPTERMPSPGIVGFQRDFEKNLGIFCFRRRYRLAAVTNLASVPTNTLFDNDKKELRKLYDACSF